jgi:hypothetical protein
MSIEQVANLVDIAIHKLPYMESLYKQVKDEVDKLQCIRHYLSNDIKSLEHKISILDKTAFSSEQECKGTEQRVQELTAQKDLLEKLIANILNGDSYSKLKQVAKENVKAVLTNNKILISESFAALIQTLKADPQLVKLSQNIPSANDGEQNKDNSKNSIANYLESNKDRLLDLAKKHYENLVEALTNIAIDTASSFNPTPSSQQSSSPTFPNPSNQHDTSKIDESEIYHNFKGDIAE